MECGRLRHIPWSFACRRLQRF